MEGLLGFALAGLALTGSPGPATLSLAAVGAAFGPRRGIGFLTGIVCGMIVVMAVAATGVSGVVLAMPGAAPVVATLAAVYMAYLAYRIATAPPLAEGAGRRHQPSFAGGLFLSLVNPKAYAVMAVLFSGFVLVRDRLELDAILKAAILLAIIIAVNVAWLFLGAGLTRLFREPGSNRVINVTFAVLLLVSVAVALLL